MRPKKVSSPPFVVYLLHFHDAPPEIAHYVGISTPPRLPERLREHAAGRGSRATSTACTLGLTWVHARSFHAWSRSMEKTIALDPRLADLCPVCAGQPGIKEYRPTKNAATREWPRETRVLREALSLGGDARPPVHEKREGPETLPLFPSVGQP